MKTLRDHWPEYAIEAWALGMFMLSAAFFAVALEYPASPLHRSIASPEARRCLAGLAMGLTAIALIYSPWGQRSGAHMNPAVTLTFLRLGKVRRDDAAGYIVAQFVGGTLGVVIAHAVLGAALAQPPVRYAVTLPGDAGPWIAMAAETAISALMMFVILAVSSRDSVAKYTGLCAGLLVATFISLEAPLSGMSMNPARSLGSNLLAQRLDVFWIYLIAPTLAMQLVAMLFARTADDGRVRWCPRLYHPSRSPCVFGCGDSAAIRETPSRSRSDAQLTL